MTTAAIGLLVAANAYVWGRIVRTWLEEHRYPWG